MPKRLLPAILLSGLIVGTADILAAFISAYIKSNTKPDAVLKFVASGVFGRKAFGGGTSMAAAGLLFHYMIALTFTVIFFMLCSKIKLISQYKILSGVVYGLLVWFIMNRIVLPLSNTPSIPFKLTNVMISAGILIIAIGLPLAYLATKYYSQRSVAFTE
ncbi:MAG TPA: hypothetical protein VF476_05200 [Chitinophagaceae bacterium]